jgi:glycosyltransferase involved in cell wall biosynthesis
MPRVSIIMPVLGREFLDEALASIEAQTYKDIELIVEEDPDATGAAAARNRGLDRATGEYIAFCDADDYLAPDAIEKMVAAMEGVDLVCGSFRKFGNFEQIVSHPDFTFRPHELAAYVMANLRDPRRNQMLSGCWAKLYRHDLLPRFPLLTTAEDMAFNFRYLATGLPTRFIADMVYHNRKHGGSLTTTFNANDPKALFCVIEALRYVGIFLDDFYDAEEIESALDNSKVYHSMLYFMRACESEGGEMRDVFKKIYP